MTNYNYYKKNPWNLLWLYIIIVIIDKTTKCLAVCQWIQTPRTCYKLDILFNCTLILYIYATFSNIIQWKAWQKRQQCCTLPGMAKATWSFLKCGAILGIFSSLELQDTAGFVCDASRLMALSKESNLELTKWKILYETCIDVTKFSYL